MPICCTHNITHNYYEYQAITTQFILNSANLNTATISLFKICSILWRSKSLLNSIIGVLIYWSTIYNLEYYIWSTIYGVVEKARGVKGSAAHVRCSISPPRCSIFPHFFLLFFFLFPHIPIPFRPQSSRINIGNLSDSGNFCVRFLPQCVLN